MLGLARGRRVDAARCRSLVRRFTRRGTTPAEQVIDAWHGTVGALQLAGAPPPSGATPDRVRAPGRARAATSTTAASLELARFVTRAIYSPAGVGEPAALRAAVLRTQLDDAAREVTPWRTRVLTRLDPRLVRMQLVGEDRPRSTPVARRRLLGVAR